jgi:hypothetical protein
LPGNVQFAFEDIDYALLRGVGARDSTACLGHHIQVEHWGVGFDRRRQAAGLAQDEVLYLYSGVHTRRRHDWRQAQIITGADH